MSEGKNRPIRRWGGGLWNYIDGVIDGYEVKTTAVVQIVEQGDTGCSGCFYVNLGPLGLFAQKCSVVFLEGEANDYVTTDGEPLLAVWTRY